MPPRINLVAHKVSIPEDHLHRHSGGRLARGDGPLALVDGRTDRGEQRHDDRDRGDLAEARSANRAQITGEKLRWRTEKTAIVTAHMTAAASAPNIALLSNEGSIRRVAERA